MKKVLSLTLIITLISCGIRVDYDYEKTTDFLKYKTFDINKEGDTGLSKIDNKRIYSILEAALIAKGLEQADDADFYINVQSAEYEDNQRNTLGVGIGGGGRNVGGGVSIGIPVGQSKVSREIVFDFIDSETNALFWQAVSESSYLPNSSPEKRKAALQVVVDKILKGYPPKAK